MRPFGSRIALLAAVLGLVSAPGSCAPLSVVTVRLLGRIDSHRTSAGAPFFVKTISEWKRGRCTVPAGTTLEGRVDRVVMRAPDVKREQLSLRFLPLPCPSDDAHEILPLLVAIHPPRKDSNDDVVNRADLMTTFASVAGSHQPMGAGPGPASGPPAGAMHGVGSERSDLPSPETIRVGEVRGYPSVKLTLPHLTGDPTTLTSSGGLLFDPEARFVLDIVLQPVHPSSSAAVESASAAPPVTEPAPVIHLPTPPATPVLVENCVSGGCVTASDDANVPQNKAQMEIPLRSLSYRPRLGRTVVGGLEDEAALSFLGEDQIFVTFNSHALVHRSQAQAVRSSAPRQIRGVLISATDGHRIRVVDWQVPEQGAYLWQLGQNRILVHIGGSLVIYGPGLEEQARWQIPGSLAFVAPSPSREQILVAVKRQKYDDATFRRLADFVGSAEKVQEDCDLIALNGQLQETASNSLKQSPVSPALLDGGIVSLVHASNTRWRVEQTDWSSRRRKLAELDSACTPTIQTLPSNLIFISGCHGDSSSKWYRVLRSDGRTLLRGTATNRAIPEYVASSPSGAILAIGVEHADCDVNWNTGMSIADLEAMTISLYRTSDGRQIFATRMQSHTVDRGVLALSNSGKRLAVLTDDSVRIYRTSPAS